MTRRDRAPASQSVWRFAYVVRWARVIDGRAFALSIPFDDKGAARAFYARITPAPELPEKQLIKGDYYQRDYPADAVQQAECYQAPSPEL